jgi:DNA-binding NarL/FixJ family response regulator
MSAVPLSDLATTGSWQNDFTAILPAIEKHAKIRFRGIPAAHRDDAVAESIAAACVHYQRLAAQGRLHQAFVSSLADHAARHAAQHRQVGGKQNCRDVMSPLTQRKHGVAVCSISAPSTVLIEDRKFGPADTAAIRIDFEQWLKARTPRDRTIVAAMAGGETTSMIAGRFGVSSGRVSQLRRKFEQDWAQMQGEPIPA